MDENILFGLLGESGGEEVQEEDTDSGVTWEDVKREYPFTFALLEFQLDMTQFTPAHANSIVESLVRNITTTRISDVTASSILGWSAVSGDNFFLIALLPSFLDYRENCSGWHQLEALCTIVDGADGETWRTDDKVITDTMEPFDDHNPTKWSRSVDSAWQICCKKPS